MFLSVILQNDVDCKSLGFQNKYVFFSAVKIKGLNKEYYEKNDGNGSLLMERFYCTGSIFPDR